MKKTKILTVLGVLLAMGITACGGKTTSKSASGAASGSSGGGASTSQPSQTTSKPATHQHNWVEDTTQYVAPGCETEGKKVYNCTGEGTCTQNNGRKEEAVPALGHQWGEAIPVQAANGGVSYNKYECQRNNKADKAVKYDIDVTGEGRIKLAEGSALKEDGNLPGYVKLNSPNGSSFTIDFYSDAYGVGKIYQNGAMDHWDDNTNNKERGFYSGNNTSTTHADENGNFELKLNGEAVDFSDKKSKTYGDLFPAVDADHPAAASGYSPLAEIETGAVTVGKGLNQISFKRVDSFNIILKSFVIVFVPQEHEHTLAADAWTQTKAPSCLPGEEAQQCSVCKATITRAIPATGAHTLGEWVTDTEASCKAGLKHKECSVCHEKFYEAIPPVTTEHTWGPKEDIPADTENGRVGYEKYVCSVCNTWKVVMKVADGTLDAYDPNDSTKISTLKADDYDLTGGWKLKSNNMSFSYKFNFETLADVKIFQRGCMDNWHSASNNNRDKTYHSGASNGGTNFKFVVNDVDVPFDEATANAKAEDLCADREDGDPLKTVTCPSGGTGYSAYTDLLIGESQLKAGENTFKYVRLASYNYIITDIILEVTPLDHQHEAGANWVNTDPDYHWQYCSHNDGKVMNKAAHTWGEPVVLEPADCEHEGSQKKVCTVCGYEKVEPTAKKPHTWGEPGTKINGATPYSCTACSAKCYVLEFTDANSDGMHAAGKFSSGSASWNITGIDAGSYELYAYACTKGSSMSTQFGSRYYWNVDSGSKIEANSGTYGDYGFGTGEGTDYQWTTKSAATITITDTSALFKMSFQSSGYSAYFSALRLVKVA